jgi:ABC-type multidrug transport system fused ATPase/permease subunit
MISKVQISSVILLGAIIWGVLLLFDGVVVSISWLNPFSKVVGLLMIGIGAFDRFLWRLSIFQGWLVTKPNLSGTWIAEFQSDWIDPSIGDKSAPSTAYMAIRQTYSDIRLRLMTEESFSVVLSATIIQLPDGSYHLSAVYRNEPKISVRDRSPIHNGSLLLNIPDKSPAQISGYYWTDRQTRGEINLKGRQKKVVNNLDQAISLFKDNESS